MLYSLPLLLCTWEVVSYYLDSLCYNSFPHPSQTRCLHSLVPLLLGNRRKYHQTLLSFLLKLPPLPSPRGQRHLLFLRGRKVGMLHTHAYIHTRTSVQYISVQSVLHTSQLHTVIVKIVHMCQHGRGRDIAPSMVSLPLQSLPVLHPYLRSLHDHGTESETILL